MNAPEITGLLTEYADPEVAVGMAAYQRNQFPFLGIKSPVRREITKPIIKLAKQAKQVDWELIDYLWQQDAREYQYLAIDIVRALEKTLVPADLDRIKDLAERKSWWDSVDNLVHAVGTIVRQYPETKKAMLAWSTDENFWVRRMAILHQLDAKDATDTELMTMIIDVNLYQTEFFINKAIGWALRQYSKTNPDWVRDFIAVHEVGLSKLSIREASKYI